MTAKGSAPQTIIIVIIRFILFEETDIFCFYYIQRAVGGGAREGQGAKGCSGAMLFDVLRLTQERSKTASNERSGNLCPLNRTSKEGGNGTKRQRAVGGGAREGQGLRSALADERAREGGNGYLT